MTTKSLELSHISKVVNQSIQLTGSKSESNRALIIQALSKGVVKVENLSEAADTVTMQRALKIAEDMDDRDVTIDIGPAGTAMRFLTSFLTLQNGNYILTGTKRMQERPITVLVDSLRSIGAKIIYKGKDGFPPLYIEGPLEPSSNKISIPGDISSQYISSLLMIGSSLPNGIELDIVGELTSKPYVGMTLSMLKDTGVNYKWDDQKIKISNQEFSPSTLKVEPDWSAASYWYAIVALAENAKIYLPGLKKMSLQGDIAIAEIMSHFGVHTTFSDDGILLQQQPIMSDKKDFDFKECPDLAQTVVVVAAALGREISLTGLETLKIKETDRIKALQDEIAKFGCKLVEEDEKYQIDCSAFFVPERVSFATYEDHRMAMAFAPLALVFPKINIEDPNVVDKSYPNFWEDLSKVGFAIS